MNTISIIRLSTLIVAVSIPGTTGFAIAQESPYLDFNHPSVSIDLSVIEDSGYGTGAPGSVLNRPNQQNLLIPGAHAPTSMLHVKPVGGAAAISSRLNTAPRATAKAVQPAPAPKVAMTAPVAAPEPAVAPAPAPVVTPAAPEKPTISAPAPQKLEAPVQAQSAPPPPTVAKAPDVTPSETVAPTKAASTEMPKTEQASVPGAGADAELGLAMQLVFANDATRLSAEAKNQLKLLAGNVKDKESVRLQLMAYAGGDKLSASLARRLSLSRALSVRSFLIENGIRSTRIDVRALGNKTEIKPLNRVDLNLTER